MRKAKIISASMTIGAVLLATGPRAQNPDYAHYVSPWKTPWTYEQADHWSDLDPDYSACNTGKQQSPIDIQKTLKVDLPALRFEYKSSPLKYVINNGHTIRVNYHDAPSVGNFLLVGDQRFQLTQFHFHRPSEERLHGRPYEMVIHLMHQTSDGKIAGVAVPVKTGRANAVVQQIWDHMPANEGQKEVAGVDINPAALLPRSTGYFTYAGSQTAPPCTEGVAWFVLKTPVELSAEQIDAFAKLYPHDVRPIQPLNGRVVKESR